jgi:uncharacterized protein
MRSTTQMIIFLGVVLAIIAGWHGYLWLRLVRDTALAPPWRLRATIARLRATIAIVGLGLYLPIALIFGRQLERPWSQVLQVPALVWMGTGFILLVAVLAADVVRLVLAIVQLVGGNGPSDPARRAFFARVLGAGSATIAAGLAAWSVRSALGGPRVVNLEVPLPRLPPAADGMTIVQLTDIHVGPTIGRAFMEDLVARVNALEPDIVAITGDLVDGSVAELAAGVAPLAGLRARHGVYFVTGNHEYYAGASSWVRHLGTLGVRVLRNERVTIGEGAASFDLAGVDDWTAGGAGHGRDLTRALAGRDESRALVLLAHQPRQIHEAAAKGVGLQLSGHTHGGQIWPFTYLVYLQQPYVTGLARHGGTWIYVSRGTGYWGPPMRLGQPSEITRITLRAAA